MLRDCDHFVHAIKHDYENKSIDPLFLNDSSHALDSFFNWSVESAVNHLCLKYAYVKGVKQHTVPCTHTQSEITSSDENTARIWK